MTVVSGLLMAVIIAAAVSGAFLLGRRDRCDIDTGRAFRGGYSLGYADAEMATAHRFQSVIDRTSGEGP